jgi:hypothetical protein
MAIPFKPMPRLAAEQWERVRCVGANPAHPENYLAGALLDLLEGLHDKATLSPANDVPAPPKVTPEDVELQVGQTWLTQNGKTVKLILFDAPNSVYPFKGDNFFWYTKKGRHYTDARSPYDLVELVSDIKQKPKPDAAPSGSLLKRVAKAMRRVPDNDDVTWKTEARAAIHEIAAWARNDLGDFQFADALEEEIDK